LNFRPAPVLQESLDGRLPAWADRFVRGMGAAIHRHGMIGDGDGVLVGVSGGKDSLSLALALELRRRRVKDDYRLEALMVEWEEYPLTTEAKDAISAYFGTLGLPFEVRTSSLLEGLHGGDFGCYACARSRKRELFRAAQEKGLPKVALGHHLDDMAETALMNLTIHGRFEGMAPIRSFFGGQVAIIRPLCETREGTIRTFSDRMGLPVAQMDCPNKRTNPRRRMKAIVAELGKIDRLVRENIYSAQVRSEYTQGVPKSAGAAVDEQSDG
jgi:tRNA 2-thiocytidine biosynthesis protein TtcA